MSASARESLASMLIGSLARRDVRVVMILADAGISPRYLDWTLEAAARDLEISLESLLHRLQRTLSPSKPFVAA